MFALFLLKKKAVKKIHDDSKTAQTGIQLQAQQ